MTDRFAFYGSLRRGCYNHYRMFGGLKDGACYVDTIRVPGFKMIDLGQYPAVFRADKGEITIELYRIPDQYIRRRIDGMELGAGYKQTVIEHDGCQYLLYIITPPSLFERRYPEVPSGDWVSYQNITHEIVDGNTLRDFAK